MKSGILNEVFAEFCESQTHLDSLLSQVEPNKKAKVATYFGAFLRRPLTIARQFKIKLADTPEDFWNLSFIKLKKHPGIHALLQEVWENWDSVPKEGTLDDFPTHLSNAWREDWGLEHASGIARLLTQEPLTTIRLHRRAYVKPGVYDPRVLEWLESEGMPKFRKGRFAPRAIVFKGFARVQQNPFFKTGYFEIQDEGSQVMSLFALGSDRYHSVLDLKPQIQKKVFDEGVALKDSNFLPMTVIDACAGAGGKTLAMADLLLGAGRVYAYDIYEAKLSALKKRLERAKESNVITRCISRDENVDLTHNQESADVVLVDAPCSGYGILRRNPDTKWNRKPLEKAILDQSKELPDLQLELLKRFSCLVKKRGKLVYGVCTIQKRETVDVVSRFLEQNHEWKLEDGGFIGPYDTDGFYMAAFTRK